MHLMVMMMVMMMVVVMLMVVVMMMMMMMVLSRESGDRAESYRQRGDSGSCEGLEQGEYPLSRLPNAGRIGFDVFAPLNA